MARRSKRTRRGSAQAAPPPIPPIPPFPFPQGPRGFRLRWLNAKEEGDPDAYFVVDAASDARKIGQFVRHTPEDLYERTKWIEQHMLPKGSGATVPDDWCAPLWHGLHHGWQFHRERGIQGFMTEQIEMMGGIEEVHKLGGMYLSVTLLPEGRRAQKFPEPHILLALCPDGEFCRLLATEFWGPCALGIAAEKDMPTIQGPTSVGVLGTILVDGKPSEAAAGREPSLMLLDPLTVLGDLGPVTGVEDDGMLSYARNQDGMERLYHPDSDEARRHMHHAQRGFLDLWDGNVPGLVGRIGMLHQKLQDAAERERREQAKIPINPQYMEALERQLETARFMHDQRPFRTVRRMMKLRTLDFDYDQVVGDTLESAVTHYWTAQMCALLAKSYPNLPEFWLKPQELGPRRGYMWFAEPIPLVPGDPEHLRAMAWGSDDNGGYFVCPFTTFRGPGAELVRGTFDVYHGAPRHLIAWKEGESLTAWIEREKEMFTNADYARSTRILSGLDSSTDYEQRIAWGRLFATAITIMNQTLVKVEPYGADRQSRRRIERLRPPGIDPPHPLVKAILLRRQYTVRQGPAPDSEPVDWSCQWVVHNHWRQQYYPSLGTHKWIMIAEHLKGPEGKPLKDPLPIRLVGR